MRAITKFEARDGSMHDAEQSCRQHEASIDGRTHACPKCKTLVFVWGEPITELQRDYESEGYLGQFAPPQYQSVVVGRKKETCDVCHGTGYTTRLMRPITKSEVIGYE